MKKLIFVLIICVTSFCGSYCHALTVYVDPSSTTGGDGTTNALVGANRAYVSIAAALAARFTGALTEPLTIICDSNGDTHPADTTAVYIYGGSTSAANYVEIKSGPNSRPTKLYDAGKYRLEVANGHSINTTGADHIRIDGLQIARSGANASGKAGINLSSFAADNDVRISNCIILGADNATYSEYGIFVHDPDLNVMIWNVVIYRMSTQGGSNAIVSTDHNTMSVYHSVLIGQYNGMLNHSTVHDIICKNTYAYSATTHTYYSPDGTVIDKTNCASSDTTGSIGLQNIAPTTSVFKNVTAGAEDFSLAGSGSPLYRAGVDTSGDVSPLNFTTDRIGMDWYDTDGVRSIGAYEYFPTSASGSALMLGY